MRKILIAMDSIRIGGIQTALVNMLRTIHYDKYDVTLLLFHYEDAYKEFLPKELKIKRLSPIINVMNYTGQEAKEKGVFTYLCKKFFALLCRIFGGNAVYGFLYKFIKKDDTIWDVAISYTNNISLRGTYFGVNKFVLEKVKAKEKVSWVHVDYEKLKMNHKINNREYRKFDKVIHVSEAAQKTFLQYLPELKNRTRVIYNIIDTQSLKEKAAEFTISEPKNEFTIITVSRLDENKNILDCLSVAKLLKDAGFTFKWFILGDGEQRKIIENRIEEWGLKDFVILKGYIKNPYPYIIRSDVMISTSKSESFGLAIAEAIALGIPAIAYYYPAAPEIIKQEENGYIVPSGDKETTFETVKRLLLEKELLENLKRNCNLESFSKNALMEIENVFDGK